LFIEDPLLGDIGGVGKGDMGGPDGRLFSKS
jgi:hypothetical protein